MRRFLFIITAFLIITSPVWAATQTVTNCADSGAGSLRQAITDANTDGDLIIFDITTLEAGYSTGETGPGLVTNEAGSETWFRIVVNSSLPTFLASNITIDGSTQTREANNSLGPEVEIRGNGINIVGLNIPGNNCLIQGLTINGFSSTSKYAIGLSGSNNRVQGCYVGATASGEASYPNYWGIIIDNDSYNVIGSTEASKRNVISGNSLFGVYISGASASSNEVIGNYIGTDSNGTANLGNLVAGLYIGSGTQYNKIGNGTAAGRNIISGNANGIMIEIANFNQVLGNYIGTDMNGTSSLGNANNGIYVVGANNKIGDGTVGGRNIVSGNTLNGIRFNGSQSVSNEVLGNYIGTDVNGTAGLGNSIDGVRIEGGTYNKIGNGTAGGRNIISGNSASGVSIRNSNATSNEVLGNFIGTDVNGTTALGNSSNGVYIWSDARYNKIGDGSVGGRNIISGNTQNGVFIYDPAATNSNYNEILGNYIGTDVNGTADLGNGTNGIYLNEGPQYTKIGDGTAGGRNIIAGNTSFGINLIGTDTNSNEVLGNYVGLQVDGTSTLTNDAGGIVVTNGQYNRIGSSESSGQRNIVAGHITLNDNGIVLSNASNNIIEGNWVGIASDESRAGNYYGVQISSGSSNQVIANVISGNTYGIYINNTNTNKIYGNYIGLASDGQTLRTNTLDGILVLGTSQGNLIGTSESGGRNTIVASSAASSRGISLGGSNVTNNYVYNNIIGLTSTEAIPTPRANVGILISSGANKNYIGGPDTNQGNLISGHGDDGIQISGTDTNSNEVIGNFIGTDSTGAIDKGNSSDGILIASSAKYNKIGNGTAGGRNIISGNSNGVRILDSGTYSNEVLGNYIGTDASGTADLGNSNAGIYIGSSAQYNNIGNGTAGGRNIISGNNASGLRITGTDTNSNEVLGNYIGTDVNGTADLGNLQHGIYIADAKYNKIGNGTTGGRNIISGNTQSGIAITDTSTNSNEVFGNYIGTTVSGEAPLQNDQYGITISAGNYNIIGGNTSTPGTASGNLISGNDNDGIIIGGGGAYNRILGNLIGTNVSGTSAIPNGDASSTTAGIRINDSPYNFIGNGSASGRNIISGNSANGIWISNSSATSNEVLGNYIGTDINGTAALENSEKGIYILIGAQFNLIGNGTAGGRNVISGNAVDGIWINNSNSNEVLGNYVGTDINGTTDLGNVRYGIQLNSGAQFNKIGDGTAGGRNIISGNNQDGVSINGTDTNDNEIKGNYIGTDINGTANLGNSSHGIYINNAASFSRIGPSNSIAFNTDGIQVDGSSTTQEVITQNSIFSNSGKGIALANGANPNTSTPEVSYASYSEFTGQTQITGESAPALGTVEVFKAEGNQGKTYLGSTTANASGNWSITVTGLVSGDAVVATGTTANPETSEFSPTEAVVTGAAKQYQLDNLIATLESGTDYIGQGIYNTTGSNQTRIRSILTGVSVTYYVKIENEGNTTDEVIVTGTSSSGDWTVTYYDAKTGGSNITSQVAGSGWSTNLSSTESREIRATVQNSGTSLSTFEVLITSTSSNDSNTKDVVKASTTASPPTDLSSFSINVPATAIQGSAFNTTITALDSLGSVETNVIGTTSLLLDTGTITPESIAESSFTNGVWSGNIVLSKIGQRTITASNEGSTGAGVIVVLNATIEITSNGVTITVPAGASSEEVNITVTEVLNPPGNPPPGYYFAGSIFNINSTPTDYLLPVTVTIPITGTLRDGRVYYWNGTEWSRSGISIVDVTTTHITFTTTHLSTFAPMAATSNNLVRFGPNPYNPNSGTPAKIWYWLDTDASTSIYVVDMAGTLVWKNTYRAGSNGGRSGSNDIDFNGKNTWV
jgi:hypothetical protein